MIRKHTYKDFDREWRQRRIREIQASLEKFTHPQDAPERKAFEEALAEHVRRLLQT